MVEVIFIVLFLLMYFEGLIFFSGISYFLKSKKIITLIILCIFWPIILPIFTYRLYKNILTMANILLQIKRNPLLQMLCENPVLTESQSVSQEN